MPTEREPLELKKKYYALTLLGDAHDRIKSNGTIERMVIVECYCGKVYTVSHSSLGRFHSCGCYKKMSSSKKNEFSKKIVIPESSKIVLYKKIKNLELKLMHTKMHPDDFAAGITTLQTLTREYIYHV
jgi:hypothetical protein